MAKQVLAIVWPVCVWTFVAVKIGGTALASWSWWWLLLPQVPVVDLLLRLHGIGG